MCSLRDLNSVPDSKTQRLCGSSWLCQSGFSGGTGLPFSSFFLEGTGGGGLIELRAGFFGGTGGGDARLVVVDCLLGLAGTGGGTFLLEVVGA